MKHLIILDAGHGSTTAGKRSPFTPAEVDAFCCHPASANLPICFREGVGCCQGHHLSSSDHRVPAPLGDTSCALYEWAFNRDLAHRIQTGLLERGYDVRLLVPEEWDVSLKARVHRAQEMCDEHTAHGGIWPNRLLVSLHSNAAGKPAPSPSLQGRARGEALASPSGWECYCQGSSYNAHSLASYLYRYAYRLLPSCFPIRDKRGIVPRQVERNTWIDDAEDWAQEGGMPMCEQDLPAGTDMEGAPASRGQPLAASPYLSDGDGAVPPSFSPKTGNYYILNNAPCMAVLTENLFMTNIKDTTFLLSERGRDLLAQVHIEAIDDFLGFGE